MRAFEDLEKSLRLLVRYTREGNDWLSLTPEGAKLAGITMYRRVAGIDALPHPPKSSILATEVKESSADYVDYADFFTAKKYSPSCSQRNRASAYSGDDPPVLTCDNTSLKIRCYSTTKPELRRAKRNE